MAYHSNVRRGIVDLKETIRNKAIALGIDLFAVAPVEVLTDYASEVNTRMHDLSIGLTDYMVKESDQGFFDNLSNPYYFLPNAQSILVLGVYAYDDQSNYKHCYVEGRCKTARTYSYYPVIRQIVQKLSAEINALGFEAVEGQNIPLKYVASKTGLGSYGKNGLLMTKKYGSFIALRSIISDMPLTPDNYRSENPCDGCDACLKACPTKALYEPYKVNPTLCVNPIGRKDDFILPEDRKKMRTWLRGCDICQDVCPVNRQLIPRKTHEWAGFYPEFHESHKDLGGLEKCPEAIDLIKESYPKTVRRNAAIALANLGNVSDKIISELEEQVLGSDGEMKSYFQWAIDELSKKKRK